MLRIQGRGQEDAEVGGELLSLGGGGHCRALWDMDDIVMGSVMNDRAGVGAGLAS